MKFKQHGGTFLGIILGVMVGLAVALGVAIYVAKVPIPFVNKNSSRTSDQDAAEAEKNKGWDPNSPLRSHGVPQPATVGGATTPAPVPPVPVPAPAEVPRASASTPARPPSTDPLGDFVAARTGAPPASADPFIYFVQAGAFRAPEDAEAQRARLSLLGVQASVSEREQAGRTIYRVRVGPFQNKDAADRVKERLDGERYEAALVRVQK